MKVTLRGHVSAAGGGSVHFRLEVESEPRVRVQQELKDADPDRIALIFKRDLKAARRNPGFVPFGL